MIRTTFIFKALPNQRDAARERLAASAAEILAQAEALGIDNFSIWSVENLVCGYGEYPDNINLTLPPALTIALADSAELLCAPGTMRLMYHDIGIVREDKTLIRHRVFVTRLKDGCEEEYKHRHDALVEARGNCVSQGPDSNFTIWYGAGYIFGYCEKVKSFDREMTPDERQSTIDWETHQLEIMDWLTDDVDWITGQKHESIHRLV